MQKKQHRAVGAVKNRLTHETKKVMVMHRAAGLTPEVNSKS